MVLSITQVKEDIKNIENNFSDYTVLSTKHHLYYETTLIFQKSIEVLNVVNMMIMANDALKQAKSNLIIDTKSMYLLVDSVLNSEPLTIEQLKKVFKSLQDMDLFYESMCNFLDISNSEVIQYDILFAALGLPLEAQKKLTDKKKEVLDTDFTDLYCDMLTTEITIDKFIKDALELISEYIK